MRGGIARGQLSQERQTDDELGSVAEARTRGLHAAAVQLDHVAHQGQSDPQALRRSGSPNLSPA